MYDGRHESHIEASIRKRESFRTCYDALDLGQSCGLDSFQHSGTAIQRRDTAVEMLSEQPGEPPRSASDVQDVGGLTRQQIVLKQVYPQTDRSGRQSLGLIVVAA